MPFCSNCSKEISAQAFACPDCGHPNAARLSASQGVKNRLTAGLLALFLGGIGVHKFYLDKIGLGFVYLIFSWTFIPAIIALVEAIIYLTQTDEDFGRKQGVRVA